ncbi:hypothetical protein C8F04DRAFT_1265154 [Mycena alexandri]|uniref:Uncharacterized protein n=1 Tax=Mycena alexandri TaxID=1745969 RepID=A0AAD6WYF8_9AGAR|nr:hypothetical protein C8F04DRAFT_1265154 [Mycena alexandri]
MVRSILVTGSNQGLGRHAVHQLAQTPNVIVFMGSLKLEAAEEALSKFASDIHASSSVVPVHVNNAAHVFVVNYLKKKGISNLDVLVNNAAIVGATFESTYSVDVFGTVAITEALRPLITNGGAILNISSSIGSLTRHTKRPPPPLYPAYSSSKSALSSLTLQWAIQEEAKGSKIRVVSICPGHNATALNNYTGAMDPADGAKIIVTTALAKEGQSGVFIDKDGYVEW